ncbi:MAG: MFS transporter [Myxococcota bacterium]|nr:MFS transporter [Myxococcales bacterium]
MFYGWVVVGVAFVGQFVASGLVFYTFGVALKDVAAEFDAGRLGVSGIHLVMPWTGAVIAPVVGRLAVAGHLRALLFGGALSIGAGFVLAARATELWHLYLIYPLLMAFGANTLSGVGASTLVVNWFAKRRATALGLSQIGASAGGMVMGPVAGWLFAEHGWRDVYTGFGVAALALAPLVGWLAVGRPADRGLHADGDPAPPTPRDAGAAPAPAPHVREALRDPRLWQVAFVAGVGFMLSGAVVTHLVAFATDQGLDRVRAPALLSVLALGALAGKPVFGLLADRIGERRAYALAIVLQIAGLLALAAAPSGVALFAVAALFGFGNGGNLPLSGALVARAFGPALFGPMMGFAMLVLTPIVAAGTPFAGWVYDTTGAYAIAFVAFAALAAASLVALRALALPEAEDAPASPSAG